MRKVTILGGSSPFTAALVDAIVAAGESVPAGEMVLYGRARENLALVGDYARRCLNGWKVRTTTRCEEALDGADVAVHQIRYGGMAGRAADEQLAQRHGVAADETLGPAGLAAAIRMVPDLVQLSELIARHCPDAWVLNLTNPLSVATAVLGWAGVERCVGLCELPLYTLRSACRVLGVSEGDVEWSYSGLNHRGFIHGLRFGGRDLLPELIEKVGAGELGGIRRERIAELNAIPLKYFKLLMGEEREHGGPGRAAFLEKMQGQLLEEMRQRPGVSPVSLKERYTEWYPGAVVPMLAAVASERPVDQVINVMDGGVVRESRARVWTDGFETRTGDEPPGAVKRWGRLFERHERAVLAAAVSPTEETIREALAADPMVGEAKREALVKELAGVRPGLYQLA